MLFVYVMCCYALKHESDVKNVIVLNLNLSLQLILTLNIDFRLIQVTQKGHFAVDISM